MVKAEATPHNRARRAALVSLVATTITVLVKLTAGFLTGSVSVLGEGTQSAVDVIVVIGVWQSIRLASLPPDEEHPYGHGKAEVLMSAVQMVLILMTAGLIMWQAARRLITPAEIHADWGILAMVYSLASNLGVAAYVGHVAKQTHSHALQSEVLHLKSDTLASLGVLVGLLGVWFTGVYIIDPVVAILFMSFAVFQAMRLLTKLIHPLMDGSLPAQERAALESHLSVHPKVRGYHNLRTRESGSLRVVELHVMLDDHLSFVEAHETAEQIESELSKLLGGALVSIHYEPHEAEVLHRAKEHGAMPPGP